MSLFFTVRVATFTPTAVGLKSTPTVAVLPGFTVNAVACPVRSLNCPGLVPVIVRPVTLRAAVPVFVTVKVRAGVAAALTVLKTSRDDRPRRSSVEVTLRTGFVAALALPAAPARSAPATTTAVAARRQLGCTRGTCMGGLSHSP